MTYPYIKHSHCVLVHRYFAQDICHSGNIYSIKIGNHFFGQPILALKKHSREVEIPLYFLNSKTIIQHVLPFNMRLSNLSLPIYLGY